jgi:hypothetical protein
MMTRSAIISISHSNSLCFLEKNVFTSIKVQVYFAYRDKTSMNISPPKNSMNI